MKFTVNTKRVVVNPTDVMREVKRAWKRDLRVVTYREVAERMRSRTGHVVEDEQPT